MSLYKRIIGEESPKVPIHLLVAGMEDVFDYSLPLDDLAAALQCEIPSTDYTQLQMVWDMANTSAHGPFEWLKIFKRVCYLAEAGMSSYDTKDLFVARVSAIG